MGLNSVFKGLKVSCTVRQRLRITDRLSYSKIQSNYALRFELCTLDKWGYAVVLLVEALGLRNGRTRFSITEGVVTIFMDLPSRPYFGHGVDSDCNTTEYQ